MTLLPGTWGVCHGGGWLGAVIRDAQMQMSHGDHEASWAGHAVVFAGHQPLTPGAIPEPVIVEARWPKVVLSPAGKHPDTIWAARQPLTDAQRAAGVRAVLALAGDSYDWFAYLSFIARVLQVQLTKNLDPLFAAEAKIGPICSGVVVRELTAMGVPLGELAVAATGDPDFICPADLLRFGLDRYWMEGTVPPW